MWPALGGRRGRRSDLGCAHRWRRPERLRARCAAVTPDELRAQLDGGANVTALRPRTTNPDASARPSSGEVELRFNLADWDTTAAFVGEAPKQRWLVDGLIPLGVAG